MKARVALVALAGEYEVGFKDAPRLLTRAAKALSEAGVTAAEPRPVLHNDETVARAVNALRGCRFDAVIACVATWSEDHTLLDLLNEFNVPVLLWAFPGIHTGSLCGAQQIACVLKELERPCFFAYGEADDARAAGQLAVFARAASLTRKMAGVRIGAVGGRVAGMTEIAFDELEIKARIGPRIVTLPEGELTGAFDAVAKEEAAAAWQAAKACAGTVSVPDRAGEEAGRWYLAMKRLIRDYGLQGLCVRCYPGFMGRVCLGYTLLSAEGLVCGCEGDVTGTVAMKLVRELTGGPVHNTDLLYPDPESNTILFSHCGSGAFSLAARREDVSLSPVRLAGEGVCTLFPARPGPVTLVNLVGRRGTLRLTTLRGEAVPCAMEFPGNPLKVRFARGVLEIVNDIAREGVGHHWMAGYGDAAAELKAFCGLSGVRYIGLTE